MEWIKIDPNNLPDKEVVAANFNKGTRRGYGEKIIGHVFSDGRFLYAENNHEILNDVTHYIDFPAPPTENK